MQKGVKVSYRTRLITKDSVWNFSEILENETQDDIYVHDDINKFFNSFLTAFFTLFEFVFPFHM